MNAIAFIIKYDQTIAYGVLNAKYTLQQQQKTLALLVVLGKNCSEWRKKNGKCRLRLAMAILMNA